MPVSKMQKSGQLQPADSASIGALGYLFLVLKKHKHNKCKASLKYITINIVKKVKGTKSKSEWA